MSLAASYAPQNFYCYVMDEKSSTDFKDRVRNLQTCFPNVIVANKEFDIDSGGKNMNYAFMECLQELSKFSWNYVIMLQNHDVILRPNYEIVQIFEWLCGANDVKTAPPLFQWLNMSLDYSFTGLKLFKNESRNKIGANNKPPKMVLGKGHSQNSLSRQMVDFMLNELNLSEFLKNLGDHFGTDEHFMASLQVTEALDAPGSFTDECIEKEITVGEITRYWVRNSKNAIASAEAIDIGHFGSKVIDIELVNLEVMDAPKMDLQIYIRN